MIAGLAFEIPPCQTPGSARHTPQEEQQANRHAGHGKSLSWPVLSCQTLPDRSMRIGNGPRRISSNDNQVHIGELAQDLLAEVAP